MTLSIQPVGRDDSSHHRVDGAPAVPDRLGSERISHLTIWTGAHHCPGRAGRPDPGLLRRAPPHGCRLNPVVIPVLALRPEHTDEPRLERPRSRRKVRGGAPGQRDLGTCVEASVQSPPCRSSSLRFLLNAGGHIAFGVRPTARRQGLATWALGAVLPEARSLGLTRVLVTCDDHNLGSARTIQNNGGVLEDVRDTDLGRTRRYWIEL